MPTIRYIFLTAIRDKFLLGLVAILAGAQFLGLFLGSITLIEQAPSSLVFSAFFARLVLAVGIIVFVCFHAQRMFDNKEIDVILTKPISRTWFVFHYALGFLAIATLLVLAVALPTILLYQVNLTHLAVWSASLVLELAIMVSFSLFASLILKSAVISVIASLSFYVLSRVIGYFMLIIDQPSQNEATTTGVVMEKILEYISIVIPRIDLFGQSRWLVDGQGLSDFMICIVQAVIMCTILLSAAMIDFKRKDF